MDSCFVSRFAIPESNPVRLTGLRLIFDEIDKLKLSLLNCDVLRFLVDEGPQRLFTLGMIETAISIRPRCAAGGAVAARLTAFCERAVTLLSLKQLQVGSRGL